MAMDEETLRQCEDREVVRCKECLVKAYYISKAWYQPKELYERRLRVCYPEEIM